AAPCVCAGYRSGNKRCGPHGLLLGLWRRSRRSGGPHEATRGNLGALAQAGGSTQRAMKDSILVCGTGIAGLAAALGLTKAGFEVSLLGPRKAPAPVRRQVYCPRVYAISAASQALLARLGVWSMMDASRITPVESMEVHGDA